MKIQHNTSFHSIPNNPALPAMKEALDYYLSNLDSACQLLHNIPLFPDTNVLLRGYSISPDRRQLLYQFFEKHQSQIVISNQVHEEFIRNRTEIRETFAHSPEAQISDLGDALSSLLLDLKTEEEATEGSSNESPDELMDLYAALKKLETLSDEEKQFLIEEFNTIKSDNITEGSSLPFPGMGDIAEKRNFPYGDYFLFHEMLKYVLVHNTDVAFLTFDVAKEDWLQKDKQVHQHYIYKTFSINKKVIFILDANAFFEERFKTSFEGLIPTSPKKTQTSAKLVVKSELEEELSTLFNRLEKTIRRIAQKFDIPLEADISTKRILDDLNYDEIISDATYYELTGIWSVRDGLMDGDIDSLRRNYTVEELNEILIILKENSRGIGRL